MENLFKKNLESKEEIIEEVVKYKQLLYRIALTRLNNEEDINEAIQETIISVYSNIHQLKDRNKLKSWVIKIFINKCNYIHRKRNYKIISFDEAEKYIQDREQTEEYNIKIDIEKALENLKYKEKIIIILRYYERYSIKEISQLLNMNENTVKTKIKRSLEKIKKYYER